MKLRIKDGNIKCNVSEIRKKCKCINNREAGFDFRSII